MKIKAAIVIVALLVSTSADAGERATGAALGAVSGAVVLGPIGAVAGAVIGYTAGPSISRSWGIRGRSASARHPRRTASNDKPSYRESQAAMGGPATAAAVQKQAAKTPPVQPLE